MMSSLCEHCETRPGKPVVNPYDSRDVTFICDDCAELAWDRQQESLMEGGGGGPSLIEQQRAAFNIKHGIRGS